MVNINQFAQTPVQGLVTQTLGGNIVNCQIDSAEAATLVAGEAVKIVDNAGGVPKVAALDANTDITFGFIAYNMKDSGYVAGDRVEIAKQDTLVWMTSGAAIARGANVEVVAATKKVITAAGVNPVVGFAYDKAGAADELIRVWIRDYAAVSGVTRIADVTATLAEINAGKTLIPAVAGKKIRITNFAAIAVGTFAATTSVDIQDGAAVPVKVAVLPVADLDDATVLPLTANVGAGFGVPLTTAEEVVVANVGSAATGGTSIRFILTYDLVDA